VSGLLLDVAFEGPVIHWRGPAPFFFVGVPGQHTEAIRSAARQASYGWGCVPVAAEANGAPFTTSLFPKDGGYLLPLKAGVRKTTGISLGDRVEVRMIIRDR
jgi:hypothetical protein